MNDQKVCCFSASDSSGHAGMQADLRTLNDLSIHAYSVLTAVTAQNSLGVYNVYPSDICHIQQQWQSLINDSPPKVCKVGLLGMPSHVDTLIDIIVESKKSHNIFWIVDPVLQASTGGDLHKASMIKAYQKLFPHIDLLTPNIPEAEALAERTLKTTHCIETVAKHFIDLGVKSILIKGGHKTESQRGTGNKYCQDFVYSTQKNNQLIKSWLNSHRQNQSNTRGTGCTLSSAIAGFMAHGKPCIDALILAHAYTQQGIRNGYRVGKGSGPIGNTGWPKQLSDYPRATNSSTYSLPLPFPSCGTDVLGLYPVIDSVEWLQKLLIIGVRTIQLRIKNLKGNALISVLIKAIDLGKKYNARLFINDYWKEAIDLKAYGVHLGQEDIDTANIEALHNAGLRLGISTHSEYEWSRAISFRPSYIALGAVYPTQTKAAHVIGLNNLKTWVDLLQQNYLVTAIGGINLGNVEQVLNTRVGSIAVVTAITESNNYQQSVKELSQHIEKRYEL